MHDVYLDEFGSVARRAWSMWNRDPASPSYGCFDRQHWGWKYKDFSDATLQYAVILAVEHTRRFGGLASLPSLLDAYVGFCARLQHADGSFDQCYPNERTPGVVYDVLPALAYVYRSGLVSSGSVRQTLGDIIEQAVAFAVRTDEKHGEIANHLAEYAWELIDYASWSGNDRARRRGEEYLERLLSLFNQEEGWFLEYNGADAGYQTRCLRYLVKIAAARNDDTLWGIAEKAARFVDLLLTPDDALNPILGCRSTAILYPSAFEVLGARTPALRATARRVRRAWGLRRVPMPTEMDFCNAARLAHDAMDAGDAMATDDRAEGQVLSTPEARSAHLPRAGIAVQRARDYVVYVAYRFGGALAAYRRNADGEWSLVREEAGYMLKLDSSRAWVTTGAGVGRLIELTEAVCRLETAFVPSLHDELTPVRMIVLRMLNLTILRWQWLADFFRRLVVSRLISGLRPTPLRLERTIALDQEGVTVNDRIHASAAPITGARLFLCRRVTAAHMASARYFQPAELEILAGPWTEELEWNGASDFVRSLRIPASSMG